MDAKKLILGVSVLLVVVGFLLLGLSHGGLFNKVIPYTFRDYPRPPIYHPEGAYVDLSQTGPLIGLVCVVVGGVGAIYAFARKEWTA